MKEFFHNWRRKTGVVMLLLACTSFGGWLRSYCVDDNIHAYPSSYASETLESAAGGIHWFSEIEATDMFGRQPILEWKSYTIDSKDERIQPHLDGTWRYPFGFKFYHFEGPGGSITSRMISYWYLTIPLTLLSAYLLCPTSRKQPAATNRRKA